MAYGGNPSSVTRDAVRLLVGDISTSTSGEYLSNTDYDFFVSAGGNTYIAAQLAANSLAALFTGAAASASGSGYVEKKVGDLSLKKADASQMAANYKSLSQKFTRMAAAGVTPYAGGISASGKAAQETDLDRVQPSFTRGQFDNPYAQSPFKSSTAST